MLRRLSAWPGGRWIAVAGVLVGIAFFVQRLVATEDSLLRAFLAGCGAAVAVMVVAGVVQRFWGGDKLADATAPGGLGLGFEAAEQAVAQLNTRVNDQMTTLNDRLYDLEKIVFKDASTDARDEQ